MSDVITTPFRALRPLIDRGERPIFRQSERIANDDAASQEIDLRQLRHHTKNTLQRILGLIADTPGLSDTPARKESCRISRTRIGLSATIADALFGLTDTPASIAERLRQLAGAMVGMMREPDQAIRIGISVRGNCPARLREAVLRTTHELVGNAIKHGMKGRLTGRITVRLVTDAASTRLTVRDNGSGVSGEPRSGQGLILARGFAARHGGSLSLMAKDGTIATLVLPDVPDKWSD